MHKYLEKYVLKLAKTLGLVSWKFGFLYGDLVDDDCVASNHVVMETHEGLISFHDRFFELPQDEQVTIIVHELLHCYFGSSVDLYGLDDVLHKDAVAIVEAFMRFNEECNVDMLAKAVAKLVPKPKKQF